MIAFILRNYVISKPPAAAVSLQTTSKTFQNVSHSFLLQQILLLPNKEWSWTTSQYVIGWLEKSSVCQNWRFIQQFICVTFVNWSFLCYQFWLINFVVKWRGSSRMLFATCGVLPGSWKQRVFWYNLFYISFTLRDISKAVVYKNLMRINVFFKELRWFDVGIYLATYYKLSW